jgi:hypothetical protein
VGKEPLKIKESNGPKTRYNKTANFMQLKEGKISELPRDERAIAKLARIARNDTVWGGCRALLLARRLNSLKSNVPATEIVSHVYGLSDGTCGRFTCFQCPECGQSYLGKEMAWQCCDPEFNL